MSKTVITTSSTEGGHVPLLMVQRKVAELPTTKPVTALFGVLGLVTVAVPEMTLHEPVPTDGVFPESVVEVKLHRLWSAPASAIVGGGSTIIFVVLSELAQVPLLIVHLNEEESPTVRLVTPEVGDDGNVITAEPDTTVQTPVPIAGVFPARVPVVELHKV